MTQDMSQWQPQINLTRCTGCAYCVDLCPTDALTTINKKAHLTYPERCTYCFACEDVCPHAAIELPMLIVKQVNSGTS